jgi:hypothetical protein
MTRLETSVLRVTVDRLNANSAMTIGAKEAANRT